MCTCTRKTWGSLGRSMVDVAKPDISCLHSIPTRNWWKPETSLAPMARVAWFSPSHSPLNLSSGGSPITTLGLSPTPEQTRFAAAAAPDDDTKKKKYKFPDGFVPMSPTSTSTPTNVNVTWHKKTKLKTTTTSKSKPKKHFLDVDWSTDDEFQ